MGQTPEELETHETSLTLNAILNCLIDRKAKKKEKEKRSINSSMNVSKQKHGRLRIF